MVFVKVKNKWKEIDSYWKCCDNNCINTNKPIGNCIKGNGYGNIIDDENIKYIDCLEGKGVKCIFEEGLNGSQSHMTIGLRNCSTNNYIYYYARYDHIYNGEVSINLSTSFNNNDIFGCGLVYPPTNITNEFPYVFFTQNGKQIGKGIKLEDNFDSYKPRVFLNCCSLEANFGNDLESKPFAYDVLKHLILKEFF
ncbi:unnamed protein product [Meloidogyne enterolobii]|uniref:Uncharacterized protein n=1 Tax=Meloidogyne enterolobii TaxID=390850 RepID=A0ACB0YZC3_MELEN